MQKAWDEGGGFNFGVIPAKQRHVGEKFKK
jgi:hypothetical protein